MPVQILCPEGEKGGLPAAESHDGSENLDTTATGPVPEEDLLKRMYEVCIDGYQVLLAGILDTDEIRSKLDSEYVRLQLWGIDTGILKGNLSILREHPLYKTAGYILLKIMRRLVRLGVAYLTVDDVAKATWLKSTSDYILEVPSFLQASYGQEDNSDRLSEDKYLTLTVEEKVQRLHDAFWAEKREKKEPPVHGVTMENEDEPSQQEQPVEDAEHIGSRIGPITGSECPPIDPSDSASQTGTYQSIIVAEGAFRSELETRSTGKPSSTVLSSGDCSSTSSESSIIVLKVIEALTVFNNCLFSIVKEIDMAMASYGEGSLSQLYAAVKVKAAETTAQKTSPVRAETSAHQQERITKPTSDMDTAKAETLSQILDSTIPIETTVEPDKINHASWVPAPQARNRPHISDRSDVNSPEPDFSLWEPVYIPEPPYLPPLYPHIRPVPPPPRHPPPHSKTSQPDPQMKPGSKQVMDQKIKDALLEKRRLSTQDSSTTPELHPAPTPAILSEDPNLEAQNRENIVAAAMTNDKSLFDLMHTYADVGFGLYWEKNIQVVTEAAKQQWLSLDVAMCMWKNASEVIRNKFRELAKNKIQDLKKVEDEIDQRAGYPYYSPHHDYVMQSYSDYKSETSRHPTLMLQRRYPKTVSSSHRGTHRTERSARPPRRRPSSRRDYSPPSSVSDSSYDHSTVRASSRRRNTQRELYDNYTETDIESDDLVDHPLYYHRDGHRARHGHPPERAACETSGSAKEGHLRPYFGSSVVVPPLPSAPPPSAPPLSSLPVQPPPFRYTSPPGSIPHPPPGSIPHPPPGSILHPTSLPVSYSLDRSPPPRIHLQEQERLQKQIESFQKELHVVREQELRERQMELLRKDSQADKLPEQKGIKETWNKERQITRWANPISQEHDPNPQAQSSEIPRDRSGPRPLRRHIPKVQSYEIPRDRPGPRPILRPIPHPPPNSTTMTQSSLGESNTDIDLRLSNIENMLKGMMAPHKEYSNGASLYA